jgi:uncharacterized protein (TIGR01777 family)
MIVAVTGASGFIGTRLVRRLEGNEVRAISRRTGNVRDAVEGADAVVNLAGEPVSQRWNAEVKRRIRDSRIGTTHNVVEAIEAARKRPSVLVSASAIGYYGSRGDEVLTEQSAPGSGFLSEVCIEWEREAQVAVKLGVRVVPLRIGIVLGSGGGMLKSVLTPFKAGLGGRLGSGSQWMSWIHLDDLIEMIVFAIEGERLSGPVNGVAPHPVRNSEFTLSLAHAVHRPAVFPVPPFVLKVRFGEMADVILASQRVLPEVAIGAGFQYRYPDLGEALAGSMIQA